MKTYFNYESIIRSGEAAEAIASPIGIGPFCGFGSATYSNGTLTIYPTGIDGTFTYYPISDRIRARYMGKTQDENSNTRFGVIAADGTIFTDYQETITISEIQGSQGVNDNIIVYAVHVQVTEPVENPVTFVAYWNSSSTNFFELYKKSIDPYYPRTSTTEDYIENIDVFGDEELNYEYLSELAKAACPSGQINDETMVLVGIYGSGINAETSLTEQFAIVPYHSQFPMPLPYNTAVYGSQQSQISDLQTMLSGIPTDTNLLEYLKEYIASLMATDTSTTTSEIPDYTIVMYYGTVAPSGWAICDGTNGTPDLRGKFIIGAGTSSETGTTYQFSTTGGDESITLTVNQLAPHTHSFQDYAFPKNYDMSDSGQVYDGTIEIVTSNVVKHSENGTYMWYVTHDTLGVNDLTTQEPIDIMPPYTVLNYIMKVPS